jgi:hypothetical protein
MIGVRVKVIGLGLVFRVTKMIRVRNSLRHTIMRMDSGKVLCSNPISAIYL